MSEVLPIYIGYDSSETIAAHVCKHSILTRTQHPCYFMMVKDDALRATGLYRREFHLSSTGQKIDNIDGRPFSTEFSFTRFLVPALAQYEGWAVFTDCDFLYLRDINELFELRDNRYAVQVVKHNHVPVEQTKMFGQSQGKYARKNWSSLILWNCAHPANRMLEVTDVNRRPGVWLHNFSWLSDDLIGDLPEAWNWLEGHSNIDIEPNAIHYTRGGPWMANWKNVTYANLWLDELKRYRSS